MEPIPETKRVLQSRSPLYDKDLVEAWVAKGDLVREVVPDCVGMSLSLIEGSLTFTLVASDLDTAVLDALQFLDGGPCEDSLAREATVKVAELGPLDERRWHLFARGAAARGVASTLSMPILRHGRVVGGVNLYGGSDNAFEGHHDELASILDAWGEGAILNADLGFTTRLEAIQTPRRLAQQDIEVAVEVLMAHRGVDAETARAQLYQAATRAGLSERQVALALVALEES